MADEIPEQVFTDAASVYATQIIGVVKPASKIATEKWLRLIVASAYAAGQAAAHNSGEWTTAYGDSDDEQPGQNKLIEWCDVPWCVNEHGDHDRQRRVWYGPVEAVTADTETDWPRPYETPDMELPGMWERADFMGGEHG